MSYFIKNTTQGDINFDINNGSYVRVLTLPANETTEINNEDFEVIKKNRVAQKYITRGWLAQVSAPVVKRIEDIEVQNKKLEHTIKDVKKESAEKDKKIEELEKEILSMKEKLNAKARKKTTGLIEE